jgi:hypothetical protein
VEDALQLYVGKYWDRTLHQRISWYAPKAHCKYYRVGVVCLFCRGNVEDLSAIHDCIARRWFALDMLIVAQQVGNRASELVSSYKVLIQVTTQQPSGMCQSQHGILHHQLTYEVIMVLDDRIIGLVRHWQSRGYPDGLVLPP